MKGHDLLTKFHMSWFDAVKHKIRIVISSPKMGAFYMLLAIKDGEDGEFSHLIKQNT